MNKEQHDSYVTWVSTLLAASVSELAKCSPEPAYKVEDVLVSILEWVPSSQILELHAALQEAFTEKTRKP